MELGKEDRGGDEGGGGEGKWREMQEGMEEWRKSRQTSQFESYIRFTQQMMHI